MRRSALCLAAWLLGHAAPAQLVINLPFDGLAQGREVAAPLVLPATTNLAGWQCDVSYNATRLVCTSVTSTQAVPGVLVVDGALYSTNTGSFRVLVYSPTCQRLTNDVHCVLTFRAPTNAANGSVSLVGANAWFGNDNADSITATITPGLMLVGDAFGVFPNGGRAQFRAVDASQQTILTSEDLRNWTPKTTNTAADGLVFWLDPSAPHSPPQRFYRSRPPGL